MIFLCTILVEHLFCQVLSLEDALCLMELEEDVPMQLGYERLKQIRLMVQKSGDQDLGCLKS